MNFERGSLWRKWDLQVHTPASFVHNYPGGDEGQWEQFLDDLEDLPEEFSVLGISDYLFLDGYRRLREARSEGRLQNINLLLPVIELRLRLFGGTSGHLRRVNAHVIFSDEVDPDTIEGLFHTALANKYNLTPRAEEADWKAILTPESLRDLGQQIIDSVPDDEKSNYDSPLLEGFNNITFTSEAIHDALDSHYFRNKHLIAVGKTEWAAVKWTEQSIADKKNVVNNADIVFISSPTPDHFRNARTTLTSAGVNDLLLDCSDAHHLASSQEKDRLGNCIT